MSSSSTSHSPALTSSLFILPPKQSHTTLQNSFTYIKTLIENPSIAKYTSLSQLTSYITYDESTLYELGITNISTFDFINKLRLVSPEIKTIPSKHIRSLIIKGVSQFVPVIDIVTVLTKTTPGLKKVYNCHIPTYPGVSQGVFLLDYLTHEHAMKALESINAKKKLSPIKGNIEAFVAEPLVDNVENIMKDVTRVFAFENLHIGNVNVFEFKQFIEEYVKSCVIEDDDDDDDGDYHMNSRSSIIVHRIRQYANKIVVEFNKCPKMLNDVNVIEFKGENIPVKPMMKPAVNVGKYKERNYKLSVLALCDDDKGTIIKRIENDTSDNINMDREELTCRKKAEVVYAKNVAEEKKEIEKERERRKEEEKYQRNKRERDYSDNNNYYSSSNNNNNSGDSSRRRMHDNSLQRYDMNNNSNMNSNNNNNNNMRSNHHRSNRNNNNSSNSNHNYIHNQNQQDINPNDMSQLLHNDNLNQLLQLLSNPSINQILTSINPQNHKTIPQNQILPQANQPQQSLNTQQQNILQLQSLIFQQQQQQTQHQHQQQPQVQSFLQNQNILNLLQNTQEQQAQTQQTQNQPTPGNLPQFNSLLQLPKMIPTTSNVAPIDINQPYFNPIRNQPPQQPQQTQKNFYPQPNPTTQVQSFPPFPSMNDIFINPYQGIPGHNLGDQPTQNTEQ